MISTKQSPIKTAVKSALQDVTPSRLWLLLVLTWLCTIVFCLLAIITVDQHEHAIKTVGLDAAPSVIAAHQIKIGVEKMDAAIADAMLYPEGTTEAEETSEEFEKARVEVCKQLIAAAKNITYATEQVPIENLQIALGKYEMQAQSVRENYSQGKEQIALDAYLSSLRTLQTQLLPNADALNKANIDVLEETFAREKGASAMSRGLVLVMGMLLVALLTYTQIYLSSRFRRRLNIPFLIATVCAAVFVQHLTSKLGNSSRNLNVAKEDSYNSVVALLDARADSFDANAAESRFLLDRQHASMHERYFFAKAASVARPPSGETLAQIIARAEHQLSEGEKFNLPGFTGSLANELNNVRFEGEGQAAFEALQAFGDYYAVDARMRELEKAGHLEAALKLGLGYDPRGSNFHFVKFDDALGRTLRINETYLRLAVKQALRDLDGLVTASLLVSLSVGTCAYFGLSPRLQEYETKDYLHRRH